MEQILDSKVSQSEFDTMTQPLEFDLMAFFKVLEEGVIAETFDADIPPEQMIDQILELLDIPNGNGKVQKASKVYQIGDTKTRPDGTTWQKTGTYIWKKVTTGGATTTTTAKPTIATGGYWGKGYGCR